MGVRVVLVLLAALLAALSACTYRATLDQAGTASSSASAGSVESVPLRIAIVKDAALRGLTFRARSDVYGVEIELGNYFAEAMRGELAPYFDEVAVVDSDRAADSYDLIGHVDADWEELSRRSDGRVIEYTFTAVMRFANGGTGQPIAEFSSTEEATYRAPDEMYAVSAVEGLTLGLAMPITRLANTQIAGSEAERVLRATIAKTVTGIGPELAYSPNLMA